MSHYPAYRRKMVTGLLPTNIQKLTAGQIVVFRYPTDKKRTKRAYPRIVFVLSKWRSPTGLKLHSLNLEHIPWNIFRKFMKLILVQDTITLIKRRYELRAPINEIIDRPMSFYRQFIKTKLLDHLCYRTYHTKQMRAIRWGAIDYRTMFQPSDPNRKLLIEETENLADILGEQRILEQILESKTNKMKDSRFRNLIISRFGSLPAFVEAVNEIENYVEETSTSGFPEADFKK